MPPAQLMTARILWVAYVNSLLIFGVVLWVAAPAGQPDVAWWWFAAPAILTAGASMVVPDLIVARTPPVNVQTPVGRGSPVATPFIVRMALIEATALMGFAYAWLSGRPLVYAPFWAVAFTLQALAFPTAADPARRPPPGAAG